jgi:hypothetical protein
MEGLDRFLAITSVSRVIMPAFVKSGIVVSHAVFVFPSDDYALFSLLSSAFHWWWTAEYASTMRTDVRYAPSDCFETLPGVEDLSLLRTPGRELDQQRSRIMAERREGLTLTYRRVNNPSDGGEDVGQLRMMHEQLDHAIRNAYGWFDLSLDHDFWDTDYGVRFTVSPTARREMLDRLLELNHRRYSEEVAQGLHGDSPTQLTLSTGVSR